jgi:hypothetical protein
MVLYNNENLQLGLFSLQRCQTDRSWPRVLKKALQVKATLNWNDFNLKMKTDSGYNVPFGPRHWNLSGHHLVDASGDISDEMGIVVMKIRE